MSSSIGMRGIWIALRAADYTSQAFNAVQKSIDTTIKKEKNLDKQNKQISQSALNFFKAGLMTSTLGVSLAGAIWNIASSSREGAGAFARINQQLFLTKQAFADSFFEVLKGTGVLDAVNTVLKSIAANKGLQYAVFLFLALGTAFALLAGAGLLLTAALKTVNAAQNLFSVDTYKCIATTNIFKLKLTELDLTAKTLAVSFGLVLGSFSVFFMLATALDGPARTIVSILMAVVGAALAMWAALDPTHAVSAGVGLAAAGAAIAGAASLGGQLTGSFPIGTRSVRATGPAMLHKGEVVYNPATNMPTQIGNELKGSTPNISTNTFSMHVENLNTKADIDDIEPKMNQIMRRNLRNVR